MKTHGPLTTAALITGMLLLAGCSAETEPAAASLPTDAPITGGYEGWWNATPASGDTSGLPDETVAVRSDTGVIVDASARDAQGQATGVDPADIDYTVVPDPAWPARSVVIIDTATGKVIDAFPVDAAGVPNR